MTTAALFDELDACADEGLVRHLGCAFARFIASLDETPACVLLACVLLSELESRGDSCLLLDDLVEDPCARLHVSAEQCARLYAALGTLPRSRAEWTAVLTQCRQIFVPGEKTDCNQPLVLANDRLYLRRFWRGERGIAQLIAQRTVNRRAVAPERARALLDQLFATAPDEGPDWQKIACAIAARSDVSVITGGPGTGKTYTVARLLALLYALSAEPAARRFALAAPSGKAAIRLKQSIDAALEDLGRLPGLDIDVAGLVSSLPAARTLHSLLGANPDTRTVRHDANSPLDVDVLVVDEASMVDLTMMADLLAALPANAMLVLLGDKDQLPSVEVGSVLSELCADAQHGNYDQETVAYVHATTGQALPPELVTGGAALAQCTTMLRKSQRFGGAIGQLALAVNASDTANAQQCLRTARDGQVAWHEKAGQGDLLDLAMHGRPGAEGGYATYLALARARPEAGDTLAHEAWVKAVLGAFDGFRILCAVRQGQWGIEGVNEAIEERLIREKLIARTGEWYAGRPVMVARNDHVLGVFNGDVGVALPDASAEGRLRVYFWSGNGVVGVLPTRLPHIETAYAMTVHKVQGSEFAHTVLALPPDPNEIVGRELIYTGITRARRRLTLMTPNREVFVEGIRRQTLRASGLRCLVAAVGRA
jgi:exodeoxyribonuclease V alpha subunit